MALSIIKPFVHVEDANGNPYVGARLYVYLPGTTTLASIYSDEGLSVALANPLANAYGSDAAGNFPKAYIAAGRYKLRAETSAGVLIWEMDNIDTGLSAGSGALPIASGGTGATTAAAARTALDVPSNSELADLATDITGITAALQAIVSAPQGRLTLTSATPVLATSVSAGTSVYYTPYLGSLCPIYDGTNYNTESFSQLTLTLNSNHTASSIYDCFLFMNNGAVVLGTGPAWNTATAGSGARGAGAGTTELTRSLGGLWTNANAMTARNGATTYSVAVNQGTYVGSIFMDGTNGQISCHVDFGQSRKFGVWNAYNRVPIVLKVGDSTASWNYSSGTVRQSNAAAGNTGAAFTGLSEETVTSDFDQDISQTISAGNSTTNSIYIGWNSTTAGSGVGATFTATDPGAGASSAAAHLHAKYTRPPFLGVNNVNCLENGSTTGATPTFKGTESFMLMTIAYRG